MRKSLWLAYLAPIPCSLIPLLGCAQESLTAQPVVAPQQTVSDQATESRTEQASATPTTITIRVDPWNGPDGSPLAMRGNRSRAASRPYLDGYVAPKISADVAAGFGAVEGEDARYVQNVLVWIDTSASGSTGGTATGSSTGTQTASPAQTVAPAQTVHAEQKPEASVQASVPINVGPGSRSTTHQTQAYKGPATSGDAPVDQSGEQMFAWLKANADSPVVQEFLAMLQAWMTPASQPAAN